MKSKDIRSYPENGGNTKFFKEIAAHLAELQQPRFFVIRGSSRQGSHLEVDAKAIIAVLADPQQGCDIYLRGGQIIHTTAGIDYVQQKRQEALDAD